MTAPLTNKCIWLTRPAHQAAEWTAAFEAAGARVLCEPLLAIDPPPDSRRVRAQLAAAESADIVIACSANAVRSAWALAPDFAPRGALLAVGEATAAALARASGRAVEQPADTFSSEGLLALARLRHLVGQKVALLAGAGGRDVLVDTLRARGARIDKLALYCRRWLTIPRARLAALIDTADAVVVTSGAALDHLLALADGELAGRLAARQLVAPSARVVKQTRKGFHWTYPPVVPARMSGEAVVAALARLWRSHRQ
jgi:uroporphyrinogen-III synthase